MLLSAFPATHYHLQVSKATVTLQKEDIFEMAVSFTLWLAFTEIA